MQLKTKIYLLYITTDDVPTINKWCLAKDISNIDIWSDKKLGEFGYKTNTLIIKLKRLARGFIVLDDNNKIIDIAINKEISSDPDYSLIEKYLN